MSQYYYHYCRAGHIHYDRSPITARFCSKCGSGFLIACEKCSEKLPDAFTYTRWTFFHPEIELPERPAICPQCGERYPWSHSLESSTQSFSKSGDYVPRQETFNRGEFSKALRTIVDALHPSPGSIRLYISMNGSDGVSIQKHGAEFTDLDSAIQPGSDLDYMELSFNDANSIRYSLTASFYGIAWWLGIDANNSECLARFWNLLSEKFGLRDRERDGNWKLEINHSNKADATESFPEASKIIRLVESKLRTAMRKEPSDEKAVQDVVEALLLGADVNFSRELDIIEYSSRTYRPDFTLRGFDLVIEIKFCVDAAREKAIVQEINDDILAYRTKFKNLLFVVYDVGCIRDIAKFCSPFKAEDGITIRVIKH